MKSFKELGIDVSGTGQVKTICPKCSSHRDKSDEPCLSVNTETGKYHCFHCGWAGGTKDYSVSEKYVKSSYELPKYNEGAWSDYEERNEYFEKRGISPITLDLNRIGCKWGQLSKSSPEEYILSFPYIKGDTVVNVKYRAVDNKNFRLHKNCEIPLYGIQNLYDDGYLVTKKLVIVEGEIDALSMYEAGFPYTLSVPTGAGVEEEGKTPITPKLEYLEDPDIVRILDDIEEIVIATDNDYAGRRLADELSSRLGVERCFKVSFPNGCKDANETLIKFGKSALIEAVAGARPFLGGLVEIRDLTEELTAYYQEGLQSGMVCGIEDFDDIYTLKEGLLTLVTGIPEIKKSTLMDNLAVGYAKHNGLHTAVFSPETKPRQYHISRLASIHNGYRFGTPEDTDRMSYQDYKESCKWLGKHFSFLDPKNSTLDEILQLAKLSVLKHGTKILIIDPYSRVRHREEAEHQFIENMLNDVSEFSVRHNVHTFIVAHPTKMEVYGKGKTETDIKNYPLVTPYHIKGASAWYNSADFILSLWRDLRVEDSPTKVYCLKSKYHHIAKTYNYCELDFNTDNYRLMNHNLTI